MRPIKIFFQDLFKFMKRHILAIFSKQLGVFCLCYRHASFFPVYTFSVFPATYAFHLCVEYDNQNESLKTRYIRLLKRLFELFAKIFKTRHARLSGVSVTSPGGIAIMQRRFVLIPWNSKSNSVTHWCGMLVLQSSTF